MKQVLKHKGVRLVVIEAAAFLTIVFALLFFMGSSHEAQSLFSFRHAYAVQVDSTENFSDPALITTEGVALEAGTYYWRARGILGEELRGNFTLEEDSLLRMETNNKTTNISGGGSP